MDRGGGPIATLECRGLCVDAEGRRVLDAVTLRVQDASSCALMGPSGAGKTTLLRAVAGLTDAAGEVCLGGASLGRRPPHRRRVALLFQQPRLFPNMSVLDNVAYALRVRRVARRERHRTAGSLLEEVGLGSRAHEAPGGLSGGEQQRVALARALCAGAELVLLDEPLTGLDAAQRAELRTLLRRVQREHGLTWIVVTHDPDDAIALGDTIAVMDAGRLLQHDTPGEVLHRPRHRTVATITGNPNLLQAPSRDGVVHLGPLRFPLPGPDGDALITIRPEQVRFASGGSGMPMRIVAAETRADHVAVVLEGELGRLHARADHGSATVGAEVCVELTAASLWRLPDTPPTKEHP